MVRWMKGRLSKKFMIIHITGINPYQFYLLVSQPTACPITYGGRISIVVLGVSVK